MTGVNTIKKTLGRRKIEIKKIEKKSTLQVTFTKRRTGLFKKASELALLYGAQIAILVQSPAGKIYSFGHPSQSTAAMNSSSHSYEEAVMRLEMEKRRRERKENRESWWSEPYESLELHELEEYLQALLILTDNVSKKEELTKLPSILQHQEISASSGSNGSPVDYDRSFLFNF